MRYNLNPYNFSQRRSIVFEQDANASIEIVPRKHVLLETRAIANIRSIVRMSLTQEIIIAIEVTIPPGEEIRLDSNGFTAFMGQYNILHLYKGEWIFLTRDTSKITISATGGNVEGELVFNERFL